VEETETTGDDVTMTAPTADAAGALVDTVDQADGRNRTIIAPAGARMRADAIDATTVPTVPTVDGTVTVDRGATGTMIGAVATSMTEEEAEEVEAVTDVIAMALAVADVARSASAARLHLSRSESLRLTSQNLFPSCSASAA
jgi:hypothetical protein